MRAPRGFKRFRRKSWLAAVIAATVAGGGGGGGGGASYAYPFDATVESGDFAGGNSLPMTLTNNAQTLSAQLTGDTGTEFEAFPIKLWADRATTGGLTFTPRIHPVGIQLKLASFPKHPGGGSAYTVVYSCNLLFINKALNDRVYVTAQTTADGRCYFGLRDAGGTWHWEPYPNWVDDVTDLGLYHDPYNDRWGFISRTVDGGETTETDHGYIAGLDGYGMAGEMYGFFELQQGSDEASVLAVEGETVQVDIITDPAAWDLTFPAGTLGITTAIGVPAEGYLFDGNTAGLGVGYSDMTVSGTTLTMTTDTTDKTFVEGKQSVLDNYIALASGGTGQLGDIEIPGSGLLFLASFKVPIANLVDPAGTGGSRQIGFQISGSNYESGVTNGEFTITPIFEYTHSDPDGAFYVAVGGDYVYNDGLYGLGAPNATPLEGQVCTLWIDCDSRKIYYKLGTIQPAVAVKQSGVADYVIPAGITHVALFGFGINFAINSSEPFDGTDISLTYWTVGETLFGGDNEWVSVAAAAGKVGQDIYGNTTS